MLYIYVIHEINKNVNKYSDVIAIAQRTSDSLNEGLPIKIARQKLQRKRLFFHQKDSRLNSRIIRKIIFLIGQAPIQNYGLKTLFLLFNI